jgi:hypothetical protein
MAQTYIFWNYPVLDHMLKSRNGMVGRDLMRRSRRVRAAAKAQVGVKTGLLKMSIEVGSHERTIDGQQFLVGSSVNYALLHHNGTRPHVITAKSGGTLRFARRGAVVYTSRVVHPGTRPNKYLTDNLYLAGG